jgi:hypothetical protein
LAAAQQETNVLLRALLEALSQPTIRTVTRDSSGLIQTVTERR